ncbi:hypothetical protein Q9R38_00015 [Priestia aryabhattai]|uniref:hypothetical protein n=1 Tax=Priestia aryabhattai TaxID=412384 RepID=UPI0028819F59|nr:hypothetical protein [Priestia aryabhattai]MDT0144870.1 hypothetical protein [Priestia aryabhattai]MDT0151974.1 hypothetical protein [Priestia aryabhattai]
MADWTTAITITGSFGAASTAQIISHILTNKREIKKYERDCLQNLYSPLVLKVVKYFSREADKIIFHEVMVNFDIDEVKIKKDYEEMSLEANSIFEEIIECVGKNLKYAHPSLIVEYEEAIYKEESKHLFGGFNYIPHTNDYSFEQRIKVCRELLLEFIRISEKLDALSDALRVKIQGSLFFTELYPLLERCGYKKLARHVVKYMGDIMIALTRKNNLLSEIVYIRKQLDIAEDTIKFEEVRADACQFLYELGDQICTLEVNSPEDWKDQLEKEDINRMIFNKFPGDLLKSGNN